MSEIKAGENKAPETEESKNLETEESKNPETEQRNNSEAEKDKVPEAEENQAKSMQDNMRQLACTAGRWAAAAAYALLLFWYCSHPDYYGGGGLAALFSSPRSWLMIAGTTVLIAASLAPNRLSGRANRLFGTFWFALAPLMVYFSLFYLNAVRFQIVFSQLNRIALAFTFWFLYLVLFFLLLVTGSVRWSVILLAVQVALLGIVNCFVVAFRGMALSAGDLFSLRTALTVASSYEYEIDWYIYAEIYLTLTLCMLSMKIRPFRVFGWKARAAVLCVWLAFAGTFYHICCRTSFLEDHDIRSEGFTHQLRYRKYDMIFTTLCTCFYLAADKPEGYSAERVEEIAADYIPLGDAAAQADPDEDAAGSDTGTVQNAAEPDIGTVQNAAEPDIGTVQDAAELDTGTEQSTAGTANAETGTNAGYETPNLIVLMNESFADYTDVGKGIAFMEDCMPFIHGLTENTIKGTAYASIFGANTPNSEYEFLTGNTMGFLPQSSVGFHLFVRGAMPSLASELKSAGYNTLAIHPYRGTNYRRNIVYPQIGFDTYYTRLDFHHPDYIRNYISDQELVDRIIEEYEKNLETGKPLFSYNVTVQNHGGYSRSNTKNLKEVIHVLTPGIDEPETQIHANLIHATDEAFEHLIEYFSTQEEPTVVIMFGDHQPNLGEATYEYLLGNESELTIEEQMEKYKVPFIAWENYDIEEETIEKTSINYLYSVLADRLNLPMTGYQNYLLQLSEELPVLAAGGYWTKDGAFYALNDEESPYFDKVNEYHILEYNHIFGKKHRCLELFNLRGSAGN